MNFVRPVLTILFRRRALVIIPPAISVVFAMLMIVRTEPSYVSVSKVWIKERQEESNLLKIRRQGPQEDTHIRVQSEILKSNPVLEAVIHNLDLIENPPPSRSIWSRFFSSDREPKERLDDRSQMAWSLKALREQVWVDVVNPEILVVGCKCNDPELAQNVVRSIISNYREKYLDILMGEVNEYKSFLSGQLNLLREEVDRREMLLSEFEQKHPGIATIDPLGDTSLIQGAPTMALTRDVVDVSPVPYIQRQLMELRLERTKLLSRFDESSDEVTRVDEDIRRSLDLLQENLEGLSEQAQLALEHERFRWEVREARRQYSDINTEYHKILLSEGTTLKRRGSIVELEAPNFNPEPLAPKKKMIVFAALFLGSLFGLGLIYLLAMADRTYALGEEAGKDLDLPLLAVYLESNDN